MPPLPGSPILGAGSTALIPAGITTDQRGTGFARLNGMVDIGAFEDQISGTAPGSQNANQGVSASFTLGSFSDQSTPATTWSVDVNWGDDSTDTTLTPTSQGSLGNAGHTYNTAGVKAVVVTVSDSYGDVGQYSFSANVQPALTSIAVTPASPSRQGPDRAVHRHRHLHRQLDAEPHQPGDLGVGHPRGDHQRARAGHRLGAGHDDHHRHLDGITSPTTRSR